MNTNFEQEREEQQDSEVTLSTGTLLAIFFGLVVVCGVFFGFGYSMGRHSSDAKIAAAQSAATTATEESIIPGTTRPKPSALEVLPAPTRAAANDAAVVNQPEEASTTDYPTRSAAPLSRPQAPPAFVNPRPAPRLVAERSTAPPATLSPAALPLRSPAKSAAPVQSVVQIAAVAHQEDADALVAALRKRGYAVTVRSEPQDKLMRVQVGPFATRADAVTMRQKLFSDGYNAIIK